MIFFFLSLFSFAVETRDVAAPPAHYSNFVCIYFYENGVWESAGPWMQYNSELKIGNTAVSMNESGGGYGLCATHVISGEKTVTKLVNFYSPSAYRIRALDCNPSEGSEAQIVQSLKTTVKPGMFFEMTSDTSRPEAKFKFINYYITTEEAATWYYGIAYQKCLELVPGSVPATKRADLN